MPAPPSDDENDPGSPASDPLASTPADQPRRRTLTPEQRRSAEFHAQKKAARAIDLQHAVLVIGGLILLCAIFYAGRKFDYVKYVFMSRLNAKDLEGGPDKFPGVTSEELIETALAAEKRGDWQDATDRFISAKRRDRSMPGILFRLGKSSYDRGDTKGAEIALENAIRFGENLPVANYYRGLIAVRRHDLPAATRFFEAAANAEPFVADFHYFWGEALRLDHHPRDAIKRYQQAVLRTPSTQDATLCQFKIRLAHIEAAEAPKVAAEVEEARKAGDLSVDWLMTDAALLIRGGKIAEAAQRIEEARAKGLSGLYLTCAGDVIFSKAAETYPEIAALVASPTAQHE